MKRNKVARFERIAAEDVKVGDLVHANAAGGGMTVLETLPGGRYAGTWRVLTTSGRETIVAWDQFTQVMREAA